MPLTRIAIGGEIPADALKDMGREALKSNYHRDGEGVVVCEDYQGYFARCADEGKPIVLTRVDRAFVRNVPPDCIPLHDFLGDNQIPFRAFRGPSDGVDGSIEAWNPSSGFVILPATAGGEPLVDAEEIMRLRDSVSPAPEGDVMYVILGHLQALRDDPGPAVIAGSAPGFR